MPSNQEDTTRLLEDAAGGDRAAMDRLLPQVYDDLRALAAKYLKRERPDHTLFPTELVNQAYVRLVDYKQASWQGRTHFFATGAKVMCQILVDHARARRAQKRGGAQRRVTLSGIGAGKNEWPLLDVTEALEELSRLKPRHLDVVTSRFLGGLDVKETAEALGLSTRTVERDTRMALAWLQTRLGE